MRPLVRPLFALVVLALALGPTASAACATGHVFGEHEMAGHPPPAPEAAPCHGEPAPPVEDEPADTPADCASACCLSPATDDVAAAVPALDLEVDLAAAVSTVLEAPAPAPRPVPTASPPTTSRLHVVLERFLI